MIAEIKTEAKRDRFVDQSGIKIAPIVLRLKEKLLLNDSAVALARLVQTKPKNTALQAANALAGSGSCQAMSILLHGVVHDCERPLEVRVAALEVIVNAPSSRIDKPSRAALNEDLRRIIKGEDPLRGDGTYEFCIELRVAAYALTLQLDRPAIDKELLTHLQNPQKLPSYLQNLLARRGINSVGRESEWSVEVSISGEDRVSESGIIAQSKALLTSSFERSSLIDKQYTLEALREASTKDALGVIEAVVRPDAETQKAWGNSTEVEEFRVAALNAYIEVVNRQRKLPQLLNTCTEILGDKNELPALRSASLKVLIDYPKGALSVIDFLGNEGKETSAERAKLEEEAAAELQANLLKLKKLYDALDQRVVTIAQNEKLPIHTRCAAILALGSRSSTAMPSEVVKLYSPPDATPELRRALLRAFKGCRHINDIAVLTQIAARESEPEEIRLLAIGSLKNTPNENATTTLINIIAELRNSPEVRNAAVVSLPDGLKRQFSSRLGSYRNDPHVGAAVTELLKGIQNVSGTRSIEESYARLMKMGTANF